MQLDIFADSRDVMLRNDVLEALQRRHASEARQAWQRFADEYPEDDTLAALATLVNELERDTTVHFGDDHTLDPAPRVLREGVGPAAVRLFSDPAVRAWLTLCLT